MATSTAIAGAKASARVVSRRPRVLVVGGEDHALRIPFLIELRRRGFTVSAAGTGDPELFLESGIPYFTYRFDRFIDPLADWRAIARLTEIISVARADLVQAFDTKPDILVPLAARRAGGPAVVRTINGLGWVFSSESILARLLRPVHDALFRRTARATTLTVFQNRRDMAHFERGGMIGPGRAALIPGSGVDPNRFAESLAAQPSREQLRATFGLGEEEIVITVSRLSRMKGISHLLEAAALVHAVRPGVRFFLVGSRETEGRLAIDPSEIARHASYVQAIGQRSDIPALLAMADVFAFPSELQEGVPRVVLEAALAGLPVVTTDMPGCADVIEPDVGGIVVPPRSPRLLADAILTLLREPERARVMAAHARNRVTREFSLEKIVDQYAGFYFELAGCSRPDFALSGAL